MENYDFATQVKLELFRRGIRQIDIAGKLGASKQSFNNKLRRGNFTEQEMAEIAAAMDCDLIIELRPRTITKPGADTDCI